MAFKRREQQGRKRPNATHGESDRQAERHKLRVAVVDDHPIFRAGVIDALERSGFVEVVGEGASADEAQLITEELKPDLILLDIRMPGDGLTATSAISQRYPAVKIVMLTVLDDEASVTRCLNAGAQAYVIKGIAGDELVATIASVVDGSPYVSPALAARLLSQRATSFDDDSARSVSMLLTAREERILKLLADGKSNREIGQDLGLSERSIKHHMTQIMQKLHVRNRVEAALIGHRAFASPRSAD